MLVPVLVFVVCFWLGVVASARWLPNLAPGPVGGVAFFGVIGLLSGALALAGLHIYSIIHELDANELHVDKAEIVAGGVRNLLWEAGTLAGLGLVAFLLAPEAHAAEVSEEEEQV